MTMLTAAEIIRRRDLGDLTIEPFDPELLRPVSYNYRLGPIMKIAMGPDTREFEIPEEGYDLIPGTTYLGATLEKIRVKHDVISFLGRSSLGKSGCFVQYNALEKWTLELKAWQPLRVFVGMPMGQLSFREIPNTVSPLLADLLL